MFPNINIKDRFQNLISGKVFDNGLTDLPDNQGKSNPKSEAKKKEDVKKTSLKDSPLLNLLAEQGLESDEIWEGDPRLFPALYQFKDVLEAIDGVTEAVVTFNFPKTKEFSNITAKTYKINCKKKINQVVILVCKKLGIPDPQKYTLATIRKYVLNDTNTLASYGLGAVFLNWKLLVVFKQNDQVRNTFSIMNAPQCNITFLFPPLVEFRGLNAKAMRIKVDTLVGKVITDICESYKVKNPDRFVLVTNKKSNQSKDIILHNESDLASYGVGTRFETCSLRIMFKDLAISEAVEDPMPVNSLFKWVQVDPNFTLNEAKEVISHLENFFNQRQDEIKPTKSSDHSENHSDFINKIHLLEGTVATYESENNHLKSVIADFRQKYKDLDLAKQKLEAQQQGSYLKLQSSSQAEMKLIQEELERIKQERDQAKQQLQKQEESYEKRIAELEEEIKILRTPPPAPEILPPSVSGTNKSQGIPSAGIRQSVLLSKKGALQKPVQGPKKEANKEITGIAELIYFSLQERFANVNETEVEELEDAEDEQW